MSFLDAGDAIASAAHEFEAAFGAHVIEFSREFHYYAIEFSNLVSAPVIEAL